MVVVRSNVKEKDDDNEAEIWGTWEELLLACAVNRHGVRNWDSVASELRLRSVNGDAITADRCKLRYQVLNRRFNCPDEIDGQSTVEIPWLDELRKLRVAELRREVQRHDVTIGSLQLKVKKLEEERERSLQEEAVADGSGSGSGSDPKPAGDSCRESNSTEPKPDEEVKPDVDRILADWVRNSRSGSEPVAGGGEASYNGSSDTIAKEASAVRSPAGEINPVLNESGESYAESKGGEEEDGTSSASLSRRRHGGRRRRISPVEPAVGFESQPLMAFLKIIRSNKNVSVLLDRRVENQDGERYRNLIRRHVDFEMVRNRVGRSGYGPTEFFRDLLLLCNNALVFYPNNSPECISAVNLRHLINKEIYVILRKTPQTSPQSQKEPTPPIPPPPAQQPKADPDQVDKSTVLSPLVVCRKRSNISSKPAKKVEKVEKVKEEKVEPKKEKEVEEDEDEEKEKEKEKEKGKDKVVDKKSTKQGSAMARGLRTNKTRSGGGSTLAKKDPKPNPVEEETKSPPVSMAKKKGAANFLNRIKKCSPNDTLIEALKGLSSKESAKEGGGHSKKRAKEESSSNAAKKNVGRPPKRVAAPAKRMREERALPTPKKRGRK